VGGGGTIGGGGLNVGGGDLTDLKPVGSPPLSGLLDAIVTIKVQDSVLYYHRSNFSNWNALLTKAAAVETPAV